MLRCIRGCVTQSSGGHLAATTAVLTDALTEAGGAPRGCFCESARAASMDDCRRTGLAVLFLRLAAAEAWREGRREARRLPSPLPGALKGQTV